MSWKQIIISTQNNSQRILKMVFITFGPGILVGMIMKFISIYGMILTKPKLNQNAMRLLWQWNSSVLNLISTVYEVEFNIMRDARCVVLTWRIQTIFIGIETVSFRSCRSFSLSFWVSFVCCKTAPIWNFFRSPCKWIILLVLREPEVDLCLFQKWNMSMHCFHLHLRILFQVIQ